MDQETRAAFVAHVKDLERLAISGDVHASKSLACMALLVEGHRPTDPDGGGEVIDLMPYLRLAA
jgi:hypothetical protein